jgi:hypothetical protein
MQTNYPNTILTNITSAFRTTRGTAWVGRDTVGGARTVNG